MDVMKEHPRLQEDEIFQVKFDDIASEIKAQSRQNISFSGQSKNCCVGIVDAVDSTKIAAMLPSDKMCEYYRIFLNFMAIVVQDFGGVIIKNIGDSLLYYFPKTEDGTDKEELRKILECSLVMVESYAVINKLMFKCGLPPVRYRVSSDYGKITIAKSSNSDLEDLFGSTVNVCSKINRIALPNHIVVGGDLYQVAKSLKGYAFEMTSSYSLGLKLDYPVYSLFRSKIIS